YRLWKPNRILIEDKASGTQLLQDLQREPFLPVIAHNPGAGDKIMRFCTHTALFENGLVLLPTSAPWLEEYIKEITGFPGTRFDDQVDSTSQALEHLSEINRTMEGWRAVGRTKLPQLITSRPLGCFRPGNFRLPLAGRW
ncbi:MAG: phage terminase large subunit, partial [Thermomicrobiales bacterium]